MKCEHFDPDSCPMSERRNTSIYSFISYDDDKPTRNIHSYTWLHMTCHSEQKIVCIVLIRNRITTTEVLDQQCKITVISNDSYFIKNSTKSTIKPTSTYSTFHISHILRRILSMVSFIQFGVWSYMFIVLAIFFCISIQLFNCFFFCILHWKYKLYILSLDESWQWDVMTAVSTEMKLYPNKNE